MDLERLRLPVIVAVLLRCTTPAPLARGATSGEPWLFGNLTDLQTPMSVRVLLKEHGVETYTDCLDWTARNLTAQLGSLREIDQLVQSSSSAAIQVLFLVHGNSTWESSTPEFGNLSLTNSSNLATLRAAEERNRLLIADWNSECVLGSGPLERVVPEISSGFLPNASEIDMTIRTVKECYRIASEILANSKYIADVGCPLLATLSLENVTQVRSLCTNASEKASNLSRETFLQLQTSSAIFSIDSQGTFLKLTHLSKHLAESFVYLWNLALFNRTAGEQARFFICLSAYYPALLDKLSNESANSELSEPKFCSSVCDDPRLLRDALVKFVNFAFLLTPSVINYGVNKICADKTNHQGVCLDVDASGNPASRPMSGISPPLFCLDFTCKFPLTATDDRRHWYPNSQLAVRALRDGVVSLFPSAELPFNVSMFPCGVACATVYFTRNEEKVMRTIRFACGLVGIVFTIVAISAYILNRDKLRSLPRRLNFYFNMAFLLGPGLESLLAVGTDSMKIVYCHSDNTLRYDEPRDGVTLCLLFAMKFMFFSFMMGFLGLVLCHEWLTAICTLRNMRTPSPSLDVAKANQDKRALLYVVGSMIGSAILTAVVVSKRRIVGLPHTGGCFIRVKDQFYLFGFPLMILTLVMIVYVVIGLSTLVKLYKGVLGFLVSLRGLVIERRLPQSGRNKRRHLLNLLGLERLMHLLFLYIFLLFTSQMIILPTFFYRYSIEDKVVRASVKHHLCLSSRCDPLTCPGLYFVNPAVMIVPDVFLTLIGIFLSLWAFRWNTFFQPHFFRLKRWLSLRPSRERSDFPLDPIMHVRDTPINRTNPAPMKSTSI